MEFLVDFWTFMKARKKYWIIPIVIAMTLAGGLIVLSQSSSMVSTLYVLF